MFIYNVCIWDIGCIEEIFWNNVYKVKVYILELKLMYYRLILIKINRFNLFCVLYSFKKLC